jgi:hypothetical protein
MKRHDVRLVLLAVAFVVLCHALAGCNGTELTARRMQNFEATQDDFDAIARAAFRIIESKGDVTTIVVPSGLDPRAASALRRVHPTVASAPGAPGTLPDGYFRVSAFSIEDGEAHLDGQLGPVTGLMTAANMPDCGKGYSVSFYIEAGDWVSHAYKTTTCAESRHWIPLDEKTVP